MGGQPCYIRGMEKKTEEGHGRKNDYQIIFIERKKKNGGKEEGGNV